MLMLYHLKPWENPLLGEKLDGQLLQMISDVRSQGTAIGTSVIIGVGSGILW